MIRGPEHPLRPSFLRGTGLTRGAATVLHAACSSLVLILACSSAARAQEANPFAPDRPSAAERDRAQVTGTVEAAEAWRRVFARGKPEDSAPDVRSVGRRSGTSASAPGTHETTSPMDWRRFSVRVSGAAHPIVTAVLATGDFRFPPLRRGPWVLALLSARGQPIATAALPLERRSRARVRFVLEGPDLADLDRDGDTSEPLATTIVTVHAPGLDYTRTVHVGGVVETAYPEGTREFGAPGEVVRVFAADGSREFRQPPRVASARPAPLITVARLEELVDPEPSGSGLLRVSASLDWEGEERSWRVVGRAHAPEGTARDFELLDDGSEVDLDAVLPGVQGSGDRVAGDGEYSALAVVDSLDEAMVYSGVVVLTALGETGVAGTRWVLFSHGRPRKRSAAPKEGLVRKLGVVELVSRNGGLALDVRFRTPPGSPFRGVLFGPSGQEAPLIGEGDGLRYSSSILTGTVTGRFLAVLSAPEGVYHSGARLEGLPAAPVRLDRPSIDN